MLQWKKRIKETNENTEIQNYENTKIRKYAVAAGRHGFGRGSGLDGMSEGVRGV